MRLIDADALKGAFMEELFNKSGKSVQDIIDEAPTIEPSEQYKKGFEDAKRAFEIEYARESENMRKRNAELEVMLNSYREISAEPCKSTDQNVADVPSDLISRADALEQMAQAECGLHYEDCEADKCFCSYIQRILDLPPADRPQVNSNSAEEQIAETCDRPKGEWLNDGLESFGIRKAYICSCCGYSTRYYKDFNNTTNYCPNCGADMRPEK